MLKTEIIKRSPIRVLEKSIHGGLGAGNLGVFTARKGVGKTACLVHVATDQLLDNKKVLHISFADDPHHIESWYKQVFEEVARSYKLENAHDIFDDIVHQRLILHFRQNDAGFTDIKNHYQQVANGMSFKPDMVIVDRFAFDTATPEALQEWKDFARELDVEIWFSATLHREDLQLDEQGVPAPVNQVKDIFSVIIMLNPREDYIDLQLLKDHENTDPGKLRIKLDPKTMLIANHRV